ncbi:MAG TPA: hypothetical protein QF355_08265, partial [Candidatus Marinimicrobia bacterium]|nr:hypothetical protein [Candidatus Neomarinimicrobiota bacterium]
NPQRQNGHQAQFPETPFRRTRTVTKFGGTVEKGIATILKPNNPQGILRPAKEKELGSPPACLDAQIPTAKEIAK